MRVSAFSPTLSTPWTYQPTLERARRFRGSPSVEPSQRRIGVFSLSLSLSLLYHVGIIPDSERRRVLSVMKHADLSANDWPRSDPTDLMYT